jgi:hypothetical protein
MSGTTGRPPNFQISIKPRRHIGHNGCMPIRLTNRSVNGFRENGAGSVVDATGKALANWRNLQEHSIVFLLRRDLCRAAHTEAYLVKRLRSSFRLI